MLSNAQVSGATGWLLLQTLAQTGRDACMAHLRGAVGLAVDAQRRQRGQGGNNWVLVGCTSFSRCANDRPICSHSALAGQVELPAPGLGFWSAPLTLANRSSGSNTSNESVRQHPVLGLCMHSPSEATVKECLRQCCNTAASTLSQQLVAAAVATVCAAAPSLA